MRLSIIPVDGVVVVDGVAQVKLSWEGTPADIHALQWFGDTGWIEYIDDRLNEDISELPEWVTNAQAAWGVANQPPPPEPPPTSDYNCLKAKELLFHTDWSEIPSVRDTSLTPHLVNTAEFDAYRSALRQIMINPPEGELDWPAKPSAVWA